MPAQGAWMGRELGDVALSPFSISLPLELVGLMPYREASWNSLPQLGVTLPGQVARTGGPSLSGVGQLAAPPGCPGGLSTACASCAPELQCSS